MTPDRDRLIDELRRALPPVGDGAPSRDLWPAVARRVREPSRRFVWVDWAVAAAVLLGVFAWPGALPTLLYLL